MKKYKVTVLVECGTKTEIREPKVEADSVKAAQEAAYSVVHKEFVGQGARIYVADVYEL